MRYATSVLLLTLFATVNAAAQCDPDLTPEQCTIREAYDFYWMQAAQSAGLMTTAQAGAAVEKEVENANRATEPPDPFAAQLHNTYQDFLNVLSFAINKVDQSEDGQALTVRFNPFGSGSDVFGGTVTARRPVIPALVKNAIAVGERDALVPQVEEQLDDLDDLTISGSWARQTTDCDVMRPETERCWGRDPAAYRNLLSHALAGVLANSAGEIPFQLRDDIVNLIDPAVLNAAGGNAFALNVARDTKDRGAAVLAIKRLAEAGVRLAVANKRMFTKLGVGDVAALIDNQPQFTSSLTRHHTGRYGGPSSTSASFELQFGNGNINAIRSKCAQGDLLTRSQCLQSETEARLQNGISTMKWVFTGSFIYNDRYTLDDLGDGVPTEGFTPIEQGSSRAVTLKAQAGGQFKQGSINGKRIRADASLEFERLTGDVEEAKNRLVGIGTITVPLGDNMSIPISVTWANKEKYLGDQTDILGAHVGISYRLPELFGNR